MKKLHLTFALVVMILLNACSSVSITQRRYNKGFSVDWVSFSKSKEKETIAVAKQRKSSQVMAKEESTVIEELISDKKDNAVALNVEEFKETVNLPYETNQIIPFKKQIQQSGQTVTIAENVDVLSSKKVNFKSKKEMIKKVKQEDTLLLVIIALFIPPLAMYLLEGSWTFNCTINLILTLFFFVPGVIHALYHILT